MEEQLADARWEQRQVAFHKHKRLLTAAARKAIDLIEKAAQANAEILLARHNASVELGNHLTAFPLQWYGGICAPDLVGIWRRLVEQQLEGMERAELERPPKPRDPATPQAPYRNPNPGALVISRGEIQPPASPKAPAAPSAAAPVQESPSPAPTPTPRREARQDGPPREGHERQVHILAAGSFNLPDGSWAKAGDCVNLPTEIARKYVEERGVANYVEVPEPVVGDTPAVIEGVFSAKIELPFAQKEE